MSTPAAAIKVGQAFLIQQTSPVDGGAGVDCRDGSG